MSDSAPAKPVKVAEAVRGALDPLQDTAPGTVVLADPTQIRRPWRATARTAFAALIAMAALAPVLVQTAGLDPESLPWLGGALAVAAAVTRVMALPQVEVFLRRFVPWLAAASDPGK